MIKPYIVEKEELSPKVILDKERNFFIISGKSIVENAHTFYNPILIWFKTYFRNPNTNTQLVIYLEYLNSSSALQISNLITLFSMNQEAKVNIVWLYDTGDDTMKETGEEFHNSFDLNFELKEIENDTFEDFNFEV